MHDMDSQSAPGSVELEFIPYVPPGVPLVRLTGAEQAENLGSLSQRNMH